MMKAKSTIQWADILCLEHEQRNPNYSANGVKGLPYETVVISVDGKLYRHKLRWEDATPEKDLIEGRKEVVLTPPPHGFTVWRKLNEKEYATFEEAFEYAKFCDESEAEAYWSAVAIAQGMPQRNS